MLRRALPTPPGPIRSRAIRPLIRRPEDPHPIEPAARKQLDPVVRSVSARPGSLAPATRRPRPRRTVSPEGFPARGPFRLSASRPVGPSARRRGPTEPFRRKASRPADRSVSTLPGPMSDDPKAADPPNLSARRLPGRPDPSARGLPDPMAPDPKTKLHKRMFRQNKSPINKKIKVEAFFLWIDSIFSTIHPQETNRMIFFFNNH